MDFNFIGCIWLVNFVLFVARQCVEDKRSTRSYRHCSGWEQYKIVASLYIWLTSCIRSSLYLSSLDVLIFSACSLSLHYFTMLLNASLRLCEDDWQSINEELVSLACCWAGFACHYSGCRPFMGNTCWARLPYCEWVRVWLPIRCILVALMRLMGRVFSNRK